MSAAARPLPVFAGGRMRIAVFASGTGGNLRTAIRLGRHRPDLVEVALVVSDRPRCDAVAIAQRAGVPVLAQDFSRACGRASDAHDDAQRAAYALRARRFHDRIEHEIGRFERAEGELDLVVLSYGRWIHGRLLERFRDRMLNQHPGDLCALDGDGRRLLTGNDPVLAALRLGHRRIRTTTFLVDEGHDTGAIVCQGPWVPASGPRATRADADRLEQRQKRESDRASLVCALVAVALGALRRDPDRRAPDGSSCFRLEDVALPFGGIDLDQDDGDHGADRGTPLAQIRDAIAVCGA